MSNRDEFKAATRERLRQSARSTCSRPGCPNPTIGWGETDGRWYSLGEAAHITAASPGGPRYDTSIGRDERIGFQNGIWLCRICSKKIDADRGYYTAGMLRDWKRVAEAPRVDGRHAEGTAVGLLDRNDVWPNLDAFENQQYFVRTSSPIEVMNKFGILEQFWKSCPRDATDELFVRSTFLVAFAIIKTGQSKVSCWRYKKIEEALRSIVCQNPAANSFAHWFLGRLLVSRASSQGDLHAHGRALRDALCHFKAVRRGELPYPVLLPGLLSEYPTSLFTPDDDRSVDPMTRIIHPPCRYRAAVCNSLAMVCGPVERESLLDDAVRMEEELRNTHAADLSLAPLALINSANAATIARSLKQKVDRSECQEIRRRLDLSLRTMDDMYQNHEIGAAKFHEWRGSTFDNIAIVEHKVGRQTSAKRRLVLEYIDKTMTEMVRLVENIGAIPDHLRIDPQHRIAFKIVSDTAYDEFYERLKLIPLAA